jgi:hypothetical protein
MTTQESAVKRIQTDFKKSAIKSRHGKVIAEGVKEALEAFCRQDEEFASFVLTSAKTVTDCIEAVGEEIQKEIKDDGGISDFDVYTKAVRYFFPSASIEFKMTIDTAGNAQTLAEETGTKPAGNIIELSFDDLFGGI